MTDDTRARAAAWFDERARLCEGVEADLDSLGRLLATAVAAERERCAAIARMCYAGEVAAELIEMGIPAPPRKEP